MEGGRERRTEVLPVEGKEEKAVRSAPEHSEHVSRAERTTVVV
jgi:hypothetical protein